MGTSSAAYNSKLCRRKVLVAHSACWPQYFLALARSQVLTQLFFLLEKHTSVWHSARKLKQFSFRVDCALSQNRTDILSLGRSCSIH